MSQQRYQPSARPLHCQHGEQRAVNLYIQPKPPPWKQYRSWTSEEGLLSLERRGCSCCSCLISNRCPMRSSKPSKGGRRELSNSVFDAQDQWYNTTPGIGRLLHWDFYRSCDHQRGWTRDHEALCLTTSDKESCQLWCLLLQLSHDLMTSGWCRFCWQLRYL